MNVGFILCIVFIVLAIVFLTGKGDMRIAGYTTAFFLIVITFGFVIFANIWAKKK
ncbi:MAG: hypothetical protein IJK87_11265 [Prevotella sp.]|nr:hypothetical protein [Prevotella sp.]